MADETESVQQTGEEIDANVMELDQAARLLRLPPDCLEQLARSGAVPSLPAKEGDRLVFGEEELRAWLEDKLDKKPRLFYGTGFAPEEVLSKESILFFEGELDKETVLRRLCEALARATDGELDADTLFEEVMKRERLLSTGIGLGAAVPHVRLQSVSSPKMAIGTCRTPLDDYESLDGRPVSLIFLIVAGAEQHAEYLKLLAKISRLVKEDYFRMRLMQATDADEVLELVSG